MKKSLVQWLGLLGVVSFLSYTAAVVFAVTGFNATLGIQLFCGKSDQKMIAEENQLC